MLKALHILKKNIVHPAELAEQACHIEIDILKDSVGKQDQYIAAFGGLTCFRFLNNGQVEVHPLNISNDTLYTLEENLVMFFTGYSRTASHILKDQDQKSRANDREMINNLHFIKEIGRETKTALEKGNLTRFAELMKEHWEHKKRRSANMSNDRINEVYELALKNGALAGKVIGAGGGGFLLFYSEHKAPLRQAMREAGLEEVRFRFDFEGTKLLIES